MSSIMHLWIWIFIKWLWCLFLKNTQSHLYCFQLTNKKSKWCSKGNSVLVKKLSMVCQTSSILVWKIVSSSRNWNFWKKNNPKIFTEFLKYQFYHNNLFVVQVLEQSHSLPDCIIPSLPDPKQAKYLKEIFLLYFYEIK